MGRWLAVFPPWVPEAHPPLGVLCLGDSGGCHCHHGGHPLESRDRVSFLRRPRPPLPSFMSLSLVLLSRQWMFSCSASVSLNAHKHEEKSC